MFVDKGTEKVLAINCPRFGFLRAKVRAFSSVIAELVYLVPTAGGLIGGGVTACEETALSFNSYTQQLGILQPQTNQSPTKDPVSNLKLPHPPQITEATTNPNIPTVHGVPVQTEPPPEVLPTKKNANPSPAISSGDQPGTLLNSFDPGDKAFLDQLKTGKPF